MLRDADAPSPPVRPSLAGRHVLLTGATGFLGKVWLVHTLLHLPATGRITAVVRPSRGQSGRQRLEAMLRTSPALRPLRDRHGEALGAWLASRLEVVEGDVTRPGLGLAPEVAARLAAGVDVTLHCAGLTDFQPDPLDALRCNVDGTCHVADLVAGFEHPRLLHVSTCYVAGVREGRIAEELEAGVSPRGIAFDPPAQVERLRALCAGHEGRRARTDAVLEQAEALGWPNIYTLTKGLAEHLLASRDDLALATVRPSIVECALDDPFPGWNEGLNTAAPLSWLLSTAFRAFPARPDIALDVVPVDRVARALTLVLAAHCRDEAAGVYQVASSDRNPLPMGRAIELNGLATRQQARDSGRLTDLIVQHLDPVPTPADRPRARTAGVLAKLARGVKRALDDLDPTGLPRPLAEHLDEARRGASLGLRTVGRDLHRIDRMLDLYRPFIHDHAWAFEAERLRPLSDGLADDEQAFAIDLEAIDWRRYWLEVEVPGLRTWSFPILRGEDPPEDPPGPPIVLDAAEAARRTA